MAQGTGQKQEKADMDQKRKRKLPKCPTRGEKNLSSVAYIPWNFSPGSRMFWYSLEGTELEMGLIPNT